MDEAAAYPAYLIHRRGADSQSAASRLPGTRQALLPAEARGTITFCHRGTKLKTSLPCALGSRPWNVLSRARRLPASWKTSKLPSRMRPLRDTSNTRLPTPPPPGRFGPNHALSTPFQKFANVSENRSLTVAALIGAPTVRR